MEGLMLGDEMRPVTSRRDVEAMEANVRVRFYDRIVKDEAKSEAEGRVVHKSVPYVQILVPGDKTNAPDKPVTPQIEKRFPRAWAAFLEQRTAPVSGTALEQWPQLSASEAEDLKAQKIRTVEEVAGVSDGNLGVLGLNGRRLREAARLYLEHAKGLAPISRLQAENEKKEAELKALQARLAELEQAHASKSHDGGEPPRRGPGRPPKNPHSSED